MSVVAPFELFRLPPDPDPEPEPVVVPRIVLKRTSAEVKDALRRRHPADGGTWVCIDEAFSGIANMCGGIDLLAVGAWRSAKAPGLPGAGRYHLSPHRRDARNVTVGYEIKVSRSDFRRELYGYQSGPNAKKKKTVPPWPGKASIALTLVNYFMFAVPQGLLWPDELARRVPWGDDAPRPGALYVPEGVGLVEIHDRGCTVQVDAELRDPRPWTRHEIAELLRRVAGWSFHG